MTMLSTSFFSKADAKVWCVVIFFQFFIKSAAKLRNSKKTGYVYHFEVDL